MTNPQPKNPLYGITLERMLAELVERYGWNRLGKMIDIRCFNQDPSLASSLKFLRRTPWAREKVEKLYLGRRQGRPSADPGQCRHPARGAQVKGKPTPK